MQEIVVIHSGGCITTICCNTNSWFVLQLVIQSSLMQENNVSLAYSRSCIVCKRSWIYAGEDGILTMGMLIPK